ncbi:hypothetical protein Naga_100003g158 [Nannochloropsis gaditana]|uniref:Uncharacterized protein n=1 Tax=Nannochloropsis gaditana TaxID=72520 RepID=W7UB50_9STRA|nr:hypothetical protein Naga_100003g158 [Nannochloropsis gaditana]
MIVWRAMYFFRYSFTYSRKIILRKRCAHCTCTRRTPQSHILACWTFCRSDSRRDIRYHRREPWAKYQQIAPNEEMELAL